MNESFEQSIPLPAIIAGFVVLMVVSTLLQRKLRKQKLIKDGQVSTAGGRIPTVEERVAGNKAWARGEIQSKGRTYMIVLLLAAAAWNLTIGIGFIKALTNPAIQTAQLIVVGVFAAIGLVIAFFAVRMTMRYMRFGESRCCINGKAGILGKSIAGIVRSSNEIEATGNYTIELQCMEFYTTGSGKNRRTETKVHWQSKQEIPHLGKSSIGGIPFSFDLPPYPPETGYQLSRGDVQWQLKIHAPVKGVDYAARFIVPVFKMDYSS